VTKIINRFRARRVVSVDAHRNCAPFLNPRTKWVTETTAEENHGMERKVEATVDPDQNKE
jgi:hypothetical protein